MTHDIQAMIDLQNLSLAIREAKNKIQSHARETLLLKEKCKIQTDANALISESIKTLKTRTKEMEMLLADIDLRAQKNARRLDAVSSEREREALAHEEKSIKEEMGKTEEEILASIDELSSLETALTTGTKELEKITENFDAELRKQKEATATLEAEIVRKQQQFDASAAKLDNTVRQRFLKLLSSKSGIAIAPMHGDVCGACNFKVATSFKAEACAGTKAVICANCHCFIYGEGKSQL